MATKYPNATEKPTRSEQKGLQIPAVGRKSRKRQKTVHLRHEQQIKWEIPVKAIERPPVPEKSGGRSGKKACKSVKKEENHEKGPRWSWVRNQNGKDQLI